MYKKIQIEDICNDIWSEILDIYKIDLENFGIESSPFILAKGMKTIVFEFSEKNVVLLTIEKEKFDFLKRLSENSPFDIKRIKDKNFPFEEDLKNVFLDKRYDCFFMTKGELFDLEIIEHKINGINNEFDNYLYKILENKTAKSFSTVDIKSYNDIDCIIDSIDRIEEEFLIGLNNARNNGTISNFTYLEYIELKNSILNSIKKSLMALENINSDFIFDIHNEQFVSFDNKVVCIDPVMFSYSEYI